MHGWFNLHHRMQRGPGLRRMRRAGQRLVQLWHTRRRRNVEAHGAVLMYHRVSDARIDPWNNCVSPENFEAQLAVLRQEAEVVPLDDLPQAVRYGHPKRPVVAITFDDGYLDNLEAAKPRLAAHRLPATVFVATDWIGVPEPFWWDELTSLVYGAARLPGKVCLAIGNSAFDWRRNNRSQPSARSDLLGRLWFALRDLDQPYRRDVLKELRLLLGSTSEDAHPNGRAMNVQELRELVSDGLMTLGAHTGSHRSLPALAPAVQRGEMERSARACEAITGVRPRTFAYPFGDWDMQSRQAAQDAGFALACSCVRDLVWKDSDLLLLPRIGVRNLNGGQFRSLLRYVWLP